MAGRPQEVRTNENGEYCLERLPARTAELAGKVANDAGQPVADATVSLPELNLSTKTAADGTFGFAGLVPSSQTVEIAAANCGAYRETKRLEQDKNVLPVVLGRRTTLAIAVFDKADPQRPIAKAKVRLLKPPQEVETDGKGLAMVGPLPVGPLRLEATADGYCPEELQVKPSSGKTPVPIAMSRESVLAVRVFRALDHKTPVVAAGVAVAGGKPLAFTDATGSCRIPGLRPGTTALEVSAPGYQPYRPTKELTGGVLALEVPLQGAADVTVQVVADADGAALSGAAITIRQGTLAQQGQTQAGGEFPASGFPLGTAEITVAASGYSQVAVSHRLESGANHVAVRLKRQTELTVTVIDAQTRAAVAGAQVTLAEQGKQQTTDSAGRCVFPGVAAGTVAVSAAASGYCDNRVSAAAAAPSAEITVPLPHGQVFSGAARRPWAT